MSNFEQLRKQMVETQLVPRGIKDERVLKAFLKVPRHEFVLPEEIDSAYGDFPLGIGSGQTISQPYMVACMTEHLALKGDEKALEIGTGSGYQAAILSELAKEVYTVERIYELAKSSAARFKRLGYENIKVKAADGTLGWPQEAPFDAIIVTAAAPDVPKALVKQLKDGGRLIAPIGSRMSQSLRIITKKSGRTSATDGCSCIFVPLIGEQGWKQ